MSERKVNDEPPGWHLEYLKARERAISDGEDSFISLDAFEDDLCGELK